MIGPASGTGFRTFLAFSPAEPGLPRAADERAEEMAAALSRGDRRGLDGPEDAVDAVRVERDMRRPRSRIAHARQLVDRNRVAVGVSGRKQRGSLLGRRGPFPPRA